MALVKCSECGNDVSKDAAACPKCGKPVKKKGGFLKLLGTGFLVFIGLTIVIGAMSSAGKHSGSSGSVNAESAAPAAETVLTVPAATLVTDYDANEVAADAKYKGKTLQVSGTIDTIGKDMLDSIYVSIDGGHPLRHVQAFFDASDAPRIAALKKGGTITVQGRCDGLMMNVMLKGATLK